MDFDPLATPELLALLYPSCPQRPEKPAVDLSPEDTALALHLYPSMRPGQPFTPQPGQPRGVASKG
jgi:hypothetical protein